MTSSLKLYVMVMLHKCRLTEMYLRWMKAKLAVVHCVFVGDVSRTKIMEDVLHWECIV